MGRIFVILGSGRPKERIESNILNLPGFGAIDGISPRSFLLLLLGLLRDRRLRGGGSSQRSAESEAASLAVDAAEQQTKKRHQRQTKQTPTQHRDCVNGYLQTNGLKRCIRERFRMTTYAENIFSWWLSVSQLVTICQSVSRSIYLLVYGINDF